MMRPILVLLPAALCLAGCVRTVASVVTAPVKVAGWGVDKMTTSQSESDRNYGRRMRLEEERRGKEERKRAKEAKRRARDYEG